MQKKECLTFSIIYLDKEKTSETSSKLVDMSHTPFTVRDYEVMQSIVTLFKVSY